MTPKNIFKLQSSYLLCTDTMLEIYDTQSNTMDILCPVTNSDQIETVNNDVKLLCVLYRTFTNYGYRKWTRRQDWSDYGIDYKLCNPEERNLLDSLKFYLIGNKNAENKAILLPFQRP